MLSESHHHYLAVESPHCGHYLTVGSCHGGVTSLWGFTSLCGHLTVGGYLIVGITALESPHCWGSLHSLWSHLTVGSQTKLSLLFFEEYVCVTLLEGHSISYSQAKGDHPTPLSICYLKKKMGRLSFRAGEMAE